MGGRPPPLRSRQEPDHAAGPAVAAGVAAPDAARWIGPTHFIDLVNTYAQFRHDFEFAAVPESLSLWITADASHQLY